uniref:Uncharacterized protein n=1 Tax=Melopsittacus undulatus TaxID=13146 RepID=A0A8V5G440_MELUD
MQHLGGPKVKPPSWSPWTPPSSCAAIVLLSNFSSPEYIMDLGGYWGVSGVGYSQTPPPSMTPPQPTAALRGVSTQSGGEWGGRDPMGGNRDPRGEQGPIGGQWGLQGASDPPQGGVWGG